MSIGIPKTSPEHSPAIGALPESMGELARDVREARKGVTDEDWKRAKRYLAVSSGQFLTANQLPRVNEEPPPRPERERETFGK